MDQNQNRDDALFEQLGKSKKQRRRRVLRTVLIILLAVAIVLVAAVSILRSRVEARFGGSHTDVKSYAASTGTISTLVSGSGTLTNVDTETVTIPEGVELKEVIISYGDKVTEGQLLAVTEPATVRSAMADLQTQIEELDDQISEAEGDKVSATIKAGVSGRVKQILAQKDDDVASVMVEHGALAVLSLDGYMAVEVETDALTSGDSVTVLLSDGKEETGTVEYASGGKATVLVTDNGPGFGEEVTVSLEDGRVLGSGTLYIHSPLAVTGYAGTVSQVYAVENAKVSAYTGLFYLTDTKTSANYDALLRSRGELEEQLLELLAIQRNGGITAPISGNVLTVYEEEEGMTELADLSPDVSMSVTITVDESDILSLELSQEADVTVSSVSEEPIPGIVTEIDTTGESGSYTAVVTLDKLEGMLRGMTASVDVKIQGVENAVLIPVDALNRTSGGYYVYTGFDSETQQYTDRVEVTIGLSNSNFVEITSGLQPGDTVYYTESFTLFDMFNSMGFGGGMGQSGGFGGNHGSGAQSGEMPSFSGGEMPDFEGMPMPRG